MDGLLVLLALAALAAVILGPIGFFAAMGHGGRLRIVERALDDVHRRLIEAERQLAIGAGATAAQAEGVAESDALASAAPPPEDLAAPPPPVAPTAADLPPPIPVAPPPMPTAAAEPPPLPEPVAAAEASEPPASSPPPRASLEERLGTRWTVWVGGVATGLGALLLVRYSFQQGYFGPGARVLLGISEDDLVLIAEHIGGWMPFSADFTGHVEPGGEYLLLVKVQGKEAFKRDGKYLVGHFLCLLPGIDTFLYA